MVRLRERVDPANTLLRENETIPGQTFEHFYKFHNTSICDVEFAIEAVCSGVTFYANFTNCRKINSAYEFTYILALRIGRCKSTHTNSVFFAKCYAFDRHFLDAAFVFVVYHVAAVGAEVAFDVEAEFFLDVGAQIHGDQVERFLVHGAALDGVDRSLLSPAIGL